MYKSISERTRSRRGHIPMAMITAALLAATALLAGCGGGNNTGSFIDQNGFPIGTPKGSAPSEATRARVQEIVRLILQAGDNAPVQERITFPDGYVADVYRNTTFGPAGRITGSVDGLPAEFETKRNGTTIYYADFSVDPVSF